MALGLVVALMLGGWVEWTGRRARAVRGSNRHGRAEYDWSLRIDAFPPQIRREANLSIRSEPLEDLAAKLSLPVADLEAAAKHDWLEVRRLLAEHEAGSLEVVRFAPDYARTPLAARSLTVVVSPREMGGARGFAQALYAEADQRRLRKQYEYAINRPWVTVPPDPSAGEL